MELVIILIWGFCGVMAAAIASGRGRSGCGWFILGIIIGPLAFAVYLLPRVEPEVKAGQPAHRNCPYCAEEIRREAIKCKHCGSEIPPASQPST